MHAHEKVEAARNSPKNRLTERSLDHFVNLVGDIEIGAEMYRRLGFQTMPVMAHENIGTSNVCLQFQDTYLELIGDLSLSRSKQHRETISRWTDFSSYIYWQTSFTSENLEKTQASLRASGLSPEDILHAGRKVRCIGGGWDTTDSRSMYTFLEPNITGSFFQSDHRKPEAIWMPAYMVHPNSAIRIAGITYTATSLDNDIDYQIKMIGGSPAARSSDRVVFHTPRGEFFEIVTPEFAARNMSETDPLPDGLAIRGSAYTVEVASLDLCRLALRQGGIPYTENGGVLSSPAVFGAGMAIYFVENNS